MLKIVRLLVVLLAVLPTVLQAQGPWNDPPRVEDHYWRRRVLMRIDLKEKINQPLIPNNLRLGNESNIYAPSTSAYGNRNGIVKALLDGLRDLKYTGFVPDSLDASRTYDDVVKLLLAIEEGAAAAPATGTAAPAAEQSSGGDFGGDDFGGDDFGGGFDDFGGGGDDFGGFGGGDIDAAGGGGGAAPTDSKLENLMVGMNYVLEFVEDRIFDKNKSDMYYDIHYVRLSWIDPEGTLPERAVVAFRYDDIVPILDDTQWRNFYNDAEYRSMREIFELRLFHGIIANVSGNRSMTIEEAEKRRQQMIEYEHHLWEY